MNKYICKFEESGNTWYHNGELTDDGKTKRWAIYKGSKFLFGLSNDDSMSATYFVATLRDETKESQTEMKCLIDDVHGMALEIEALQHHKDDSEAYQKRAMEIYTTLSKQIEALETAIDVCSKKRQIAQSSYQHIVEQISPFSDFMHNHPKHIESGAVLTDVAIQWITGLESENKRLLEWGVESEAIYRKESGENKQLRQQLADALGADETTADSLNMEFRHNPNDDIEVIETNDDKSQCNVCGEYKPNVGVVWADDGGIITACPDCNNGNNPIVQNFDDTESNMPH